MSDLMQPTDPAISAATLSALTDLRGVDAAAASEFTKNLAASVPAPIAAKADIIFVAFYGRLTVQPTVKEYKKWEFTVDSWGLGASGGTSIGIMYTAYDSWDAFFKNVTSYHVQGLADAGGILQVNWFNSSGIPVGQFNGAMVGVGGLEAGGSGKWEKN